MRDATALNTASVNMDRQLVPMASHERDEIVYHHKRAHIRTMTCLCSHVCDIRTYVYMYVLHTSNANVLKQLRLTIS